MFANNILMKITQLKLVTCAGCDENLSVGTWANQRVAKELEYLTKIQFQYKS